MQLTSEHSLSLGRDAGMKQQLRLPISASNIVVVKALRGLGDILVGIPGLRALRGHYPDAHIALIGLPWTAEIWRRTAAYVDELIEFQGWPGIVDTPFDPARVPGAMLDLQAREFDLAIQMHGSGVTSNPYTSLLAAQTAAGYYLPQNYRPDGLFVPYREDLPQPVLWVSLLEQLGVEPRGYGLELNLLDEDVLEREALLGTFGAADYEYAVLHPGAEHPARRWDARYFGEVARVLAGRGLRVLVTGSIYERELADAVVAYAGSHGVVSAAGRTSLGGLAAVVSGARLLVANDTGVSHLAAALRTPSVIVYMPVCERERWQPLDVTLHRAVHPPSLGAVIAEVDSLLGAVGPRVPGVAALRYAM